MKKRKVSRVKRALLKIRKSKRRLLKGWTQPRGSESDLKDLTIMSSQELEDTKGLKPVN